MGSRRLGRGDSEAEGHAFSRDLLSCLSSSAAGASALGSSHGRTEFWRELSGFLAQEFKLHFKFYIRLNAGSLSSWPAPLPAS